MVYFRGRKLTRLLLTFLLLLLVLPLLQYYVLRLVQPEAVSFREPRGAALKVSTNITQSVSSLPAVTRFLYYLHDFYQNGL
ncbi:MAG: DUF4227 family protein [Dethiobacteraceae bacterium]|jgi:hypothetical protein|nr:DUF4227 family protein [Bacillota bacterium]